ncbi:OLC1v1007995C1 [Oldenlandia corymbosa var. corymbosa]|uniref:Mannosyltransferase n=1 Tax=Oldenlandia corymbosa var. corymbosa TaxID=529605 RepID=A0AAV1DN10_OLDCO|nr:OLC1v1007995C1 [Oldenlandia corymbosa var. corymbosa]
MFDRSPNLLIGISVYFLTQINAGDSLSRRIPIGDKILNLEADEAAVPLLKSFSRGRGDGTASVMKQRKNLSADFNSAAVRNGTPNNNCSNDDYDDIEERVHLSNSKSSLQNVFWFCLVFRMINALLVQTYFNPDEHWQALEVAHRITFGYGHLTWEWKRGIRSYLHPAIFALLYKVLAIFHLDTPLFMVKAPRLLQSIFSAFGDLYSYKLSKIVFGEYVAKWATVLTLASLYYWPCIRGSSTESTVTSRSWALALAALACALRPTSAIIWLYVGVLELLSTRHRVKLIFCEAVPIGALVLGLTLLLDRLMYGSWVFVPLNFLMFNFLSSGGDYYGTHPWHWYFTQGFTVMLLTFLPFMVAGIVMSKKWKLSGLIAWVLGIYSILGHKEFRFVLPVLPIALMFSGYTLTKLGRIGHLNGRRKTPRTSSPLKKQVAVAFILATNIPMALYMSMVHQRGTEDVMYYLANRAVEGKVKSILFLTPCHATPYYSTLHHKIPMRFLDCTPSEEKGMLDESDKFLMDPVGFTTELAKNWSMPSHIVVFDTQEKLLRDFLVSHNFHEVKRFFHAHFKVDRELQASIVLYALKGQ